MRRVGRWVAGSLGALVLLAAVIARVASGQDLAVVLGGIAAGVAIIGMIVLAVWLPSGLTLREARRRSREHLVLVAGDPSIAAAATAWRSTDLVRIPAPSTYVVLELASEHIGMWGGGLAAERIATIPASAIESVTREHGPFHTTSPIPYLSVQLSGGAPEIRFAVTSFGPLKTMSRGQTAAFAQALADRYAVPLRKWDATQNL